MVGSLNQVLKDSFKIPYKLENHKVATIAIKTPKSNWSNLLTQISPAGA